MFYNKFYHYFYLFYLNSIALIEEFLESYFKTDLVIPSLVLLEFFIRYLPV